MTWEQVGGKIGKIWKFTDEMAKIENSLDGADGLGESGSRQECGDGSKIEPKSVGYGAYNEVYRVWEGGQSWAWKVFRTLHEPEALVGMADINFIRKNLSGLTQPGMMQRSSWLYSCEFVRQLDHDGVCID